MDKDNQVKEQQDLPGWQYYTWPSPREEQIQHLYCTGKISKEEKEKRFHKVHDEELQIYKKAQQDMLDVGFIKRYSHPSSQSLKRIELIKDEEYCDSCQMKGKCNNKEKLVDCDGFTYWRLGTLYQLAADQPVVVELEKKIETLKAQLQPAEEEVEKLPLLTKSSKPNPYICSACDAEDCRGCGESAYQNGFEAGAVQQHISDTSKLSALIKSREGKVAGEIFVEINGYINDVRCRVNGKKLFCLPQEKFNATIARYSPESER